MNVTMPFDDPSVLLLAGDWHGNTGAAAAAVSAARVSNASVVLQLGDFGVWHGQSGERFLDEVSRLAVSANVDVLFVDGNHENFDVLHAMPVDECGLRQVRERLWHVPRGSRWSWQGIRFAALGGATSLDRSMRRPGVSWWPQEPVSAADVAEVLAGGQADVLVSHDCPTGVAIPGIDHRVPVPFWPLDALEVAWDHRDVLAGAAAGLDVTHVLHGHFHVAYTTLARLDGVSHPVRAVGLGSDTDPIDQRVAAVHLDDLAVDSALLRASTFDVAARPDGDFDGPAV